MLLPTCYKQLNATNEPFTKCVLWSVRRAQFEASFQTSVGSVLTCTKLKKTRRITIWNGPQQTNLYMMTKHCVIDHSAGHETLCTKASKKKKKILFKIWMNRLPNIYIDSKYLRFFAPCMILLQLPFQAFSCDVIDLFSLGALAWAVAAHVLKKVVLLSISKLFTHALVTS